MRKVIDYHRKGMQAGGFGKAAGAGRGISNVIIH